MPMDEIWKIKDRTERAAAFAARDCRRVAVTAKWFYEHPDITGYVYDRLSAEVGFDPWRIITGCDMFKDESKVILEYGLAGEMIVDLDSRVYVGRKEYEQSK